MLMTMKKKKRTYCFLLSRHEVVRRMTVADGAIDFEANEEFIVIVRHSSSSYRCSF